MVLEKTLESPLDCKEIQPVHPKGGVAFQAPPGSQASSCLSNGTLLASRVVQGVSGPLTSCMWNLRVFPEDAWGCQCPFVLYRAAAPVLVSQEVRRGAQGASCVAPGKLGLDVMRNAGLEEAQAGIKIPGRNINNRIPGATQEAP